MLKYCSLVACHGSDQFQTSTSPTVSANPEEKTSPSVPSPYNDKHTSGFANLKFRTKLESRGIPKRSMRQLCSFNASLADKAQKFRKRSSKNDKTWVVSWWRKQYKEEEQMRFRWKCPVCHPLNHIDPSFMPTSCCSTLVHEACFLDFDLCPDCN